MKIGDVMMEIGISVPSKTCARETKQRRSARFQVPTNRTHVEQESYLCRLGSASRSSASPARFLGLDEVIIMAKNRRGGALNFAI
jgi:hypothetical protein